MSISIFLKQSVASILYSTGFITSKLMEAGRKGFLILMYHRILPEEEARGVTQAGMYVDPSTFRVHVSFLNDNFTIIPLERVREISQVDLDIVEKPFCAITFDDGWADFYRHAFPVLRASNTPSTVFLPTELISTYDTFWSEKVVRLFHERRSVPPLQDKAEHPEVHAIEHLKGSIDARIERSIALLKDKKVEEAEGIVCELSKRWHVSIEKDEREFLTWEAVRELYRSGLVTFGSHTAKHRILTKLTRDEVAAELEISKSRLLTEGVADPDFFPFCYPNGDYTEDIAEAVEKAGYSLAVTTKEGWNRPEDRIFTLSRIGIHNDVTKTPAMLGGRITGIF